MNSERALLYLWMRHSRLEYVGAPLLKFSTPYLSKYGGWRAFAMRSAVKTFASIQVLFLANYRSGYACLFGLRWIYFSSNFLKYDLKNIMRARSCYAEDMYSQDLCRLAKPKIQPAFVTMLVLILLGTHRMRSKLGSEPSQPGLSPKPTPRPRTHGTQALPSPQAVPPEGNTSLRTQGSLNTPLSGLTREQQTQRFLL